MNLTQTYRLGAFQSLASLPQLSHEAKKRLKWMDYYRKTGNAAQVCRYFGIARQTFYEWKRRYDPYRSESLEERSRRPKRTRKWQVSRIEEFRILSLRRRHLRYGKEKLRVLYQQERQESISSFLRRLNYLFDGKIENLQTDNGSEFSKHFRDAAEKLMLPQYFSRPKTPADNPFDERFNRTLEEEFIQMGNMTADCDIFNKRLAEWLIEYNFKRPHQTLDYEVPVEYHYKYQKVSPMYPSSTWA